MHGGKNTFRLEDLEGNRKNNNEKDMEGGKADRILRD